MTYLFDGTYIGFLSAVFESFERKEFKIAIGVKSTTNQSLFEEYREIESDIEKSKRVLKGIELKAGKKVAKDCFRCFLSEDKQAIQYLFELIQIFFISGPEILNNYGDTKVLYYHLTLKKVSRERHRMQAFIRFQQSNDGLFFAIIDPDFNVLPLLTTFFRNRYKDQSWLIYDVKRDYGMLYDLQTIKEVVLEKEESSSLSLEKTVDYSEKEEFFQELWKQYFKSTNIVERKNLKLHIRHVPKRYWKYLTEKQ